MIIMRDKSFGFMETLKGNPKLREALKVYNREKILPEILDEFPEFKGHDDFLKLLTCIQKNEVGKYAQFTSDNGAAIRIININGVMDQVGGKSAGSFRKGEGRIIMLWSNYGDNDYVVSYIPETKKYVVTKESPKWNLMARGINYLFGDHGPQHIEEFRTFGEALKFMNTALRVVVYSERTYSRGDRDSAWWAEKIRKEGNNVSPKMRAKWEERYQHELNAEREEAAQAAKEGAKKAGGKTWENYKAQEEAARKKAYQEAEKKAYDETIKGYKSTINNIAKSSRRGNFKSAKNLYNGFSKITKNDLNKPTIAAGAILGVTAATSAYAGHQNKKKWEETKRKAAKTFSEKHSKEWYLGKETEKQEEARKGGRKIIAGTGVLGGAAIGGINAAGEYDDVKRSGKYLKDLQNWDKEAQHRSVNTVLRDQPHVADELHKHIDEVYGKHEKVINRYLKGAQKKALKSGAKKVAIGTTIGSAIGGLAAYGYNADQKARNERFNYRRRAAGRKNDDSKKK